MKERKMPENLEIFAEYPYFGVKDKKTGNVIVPPRYERIYFFEKYIKTMCFFSASFYKYDGTLIVDASAGRCSYHDDNFFVFEKTAGENYIFIVYNSKGEKIIEELGWKISFTESNIIITECIDRSDLGMVPPAWIDHVYTHQGELLNIIHR